jgi:hypothetical protein
MTGMKTKTNTNILISLSIFSLLSLNLYSQTTFKWGKQFGSAKEEYVMNHLVDSHGNIIVAGKTTGNMGGQNAGGNDGFLAKIDPDSKLLWTKQFGTSGDEDIQWSAIDTSDCVYITGSTTGSLGAKNAGKEDIIIIKFDPDGKPLWSQQIGTDSTDVGKGIYVDNKGFLFVTGYTLGNLGINSKGNSDGFVIKLDVAGNTIYAYQFGTPENDMCNSITGSSGEIYVCGTTSGDLAEKNKGFLDMFVGEITDKGQPVKFTQTGSEGFDIPMDIKVDKDKNIYVGGTTSGNWGCQQIGEGDCFLTKINNTGEVLWVSQFGSKGHDGVRSVALNDKATDNILVSGLIHLPPANAFIRMLKKDGTFVWEKQIAKEGKKEEASGKSVTIDDSGIIYHVGLTGSDLFGTAPGGHGFYLVKLTLDHNSQTKK